MPDEKRSAPSHAGKAPSNACPGLPARVRAHVAFFATVGQYFFVIDETFAQILYIDSKDVKIEPLGALSAMISLRFCVCLIAISLGSHSALAKNETLAERGKRMCEDAGVSLEDCAILPPTLRGHTASIRPAPRPAIDAPAAAARFGTGTYGWCEDCTSLFAAAPVTPWSAFNGASSWSDGDDGFSVSRNDQAPDPDDSSPGGDPDDGGREDGDGGDNGDTGDNGDDGGDDRGDTGDNGGENCE